MAAPVYHEVYGNNTYTNNLNAPLTITSTSQTDYIMLLTVYNEHQGTAAATVTSVTSAGVTWALRKRSNSSTTGGLETWWAHGTGTLSSYVITVHFSGAYDDACASVAIITGCVSTSAPFDNNVVLPAALSGPTATWTPSFSGISTSSTDDLLVFATGSVGGGGTPAAGFTNISNLHNPGGAWSSNMFVDVSSVTALQSNATFTYGTALSNPFGQTSGEAIFDALAGNLPAGGGTTQARAMVLA